MMELVRRLSIRNRIFASFGLVSLIFLGFGLNSISSLSTVQNRVETLVESSTPAALNSLAVSDLVKETTAALGFYLLSKDAEHAARIEDDEGKIDELLAEIALLEAVKNDPQSRDILQRVQGQLAELRALTPRLLELATNDAENLPAMGFANRTTNALYRAKLQQLSSLIEGEQGADMAELLSEVADGVSNEGEPSQGRDEVVRDVTAALAATVGARRDLFYHLATLRYRWLSLNNETRLFLAFRAPQAVENLATFKTSIINALAEVEARRELLNFEQDAALSDFQQGLDEYWSGIDQLIALHQAPDWRQDAYLVKTRVAPLVDEITGSLSSLVERQRGAMRAANVEVVRLYETKRTAIIVSIALVAGLIGLIAWFLARGITRPLARAAHVAERVAQGDLDNRIDVAANDEAGKLMLALDKMQRDLRQRMNDAEESAAANLRVRRALDNVGVPVTLSGSDDNLIYLNTAARSLFSGMEQAWRQSFPDYAVDQLVGKRLADYLDDPQLVAAYRAQLDGETIIEGTVAARRMRLTASPVYDDAGEYQGRVSQWHDRTDELAAQEEQRVRLEAEREAAAENLRIKIALDNVSSNVMMADPQRNIVYLNRSARALFSEASEDLRADLPEFDPATLVGQKVDYIYRGASRQADMLDNLRSSHNDEIRIGSRVMRIIANPVLDETGERLGTAVEWTDRTQEVAVEEQIQSLVEAARAGDLTRRVDEAGKEGFFRLLASGFNALLGELSNVFDEIARVMSTMADGDLQQRIQGDYRGTFAEVQSDINRTLDNLQDMIGRLLTTADNVGTAAEEINSGNQNLSNRTEQQASSLEQTAASLEQLTATVRNNADNAQQANQVSTAARASAQRGGDVVSQAVNAMQEINSSSNRIAEIIGVIDEIAFQTNLLALNASVEAARAGEQGRGFAVVATEVRNLASRSAGAAKEIKELIRDSLDKVETGSTLVNQSGETLQEIVDGVKKVGDIVAEISAASNEQAQGIDQVNVAVSTMDEMTQQNAALAEQTSAASQSMREHAATMRDLVGFFRTGGDRPGLRAATSAPTSSTIRQKPAATVTKPAVSPAPKPAPAAVTKSKPAAPPTASKATPKPPPAVSATDDDEWEEF